MPTFCGKQSNAFPEHVDDLNLTESPAAKAAKTRSGILWAKPYL